MSELPRFFLVPCPVFCCMSKNMLHVCLSVLSIHPQTWIATGNSGLGWVCWMRKTLIASRFDSWEQWKSWLGCLLQRYGKASHGEMITWLVLPLKVFYLESMVPGLLCLLHVYQRQGKGILDLKARSRMKSDRYQARVLLPKMETSISTLDPALSYNTLPSQRRSTLSFDTSPGSPTIPTSNVQRSRELVGREVRTLCLALGLFDRITLPT